MRKTNTPDVYALDKPAQRSILQVYLMLQDKILKKDWIDGLCVEMKQMWYSGEITGMEYHITLDHFTGNKPELFKHTFFYIHPTYQVNTGYWWRTDDPRSAAQRKKFLAMLIAREKQKIYKSIAL